MPSPHPMFLPDPHGPPQSAFEALICDFVAFQKASYSLLSSSLEKIAKIIDLGLPKSCQTPTKILSKSTSQKTCDVSSIFTWLFMFVAKPTSKKRAPTQCFVDFSHDSAYHFSNIFDPKNLLKTFPKRRPNPCKIDVENVWFFNIDFFGFWTRFRRLLGFQVGAKLALKASKNCGGRPLRPS